MELSKAAAAAAATHVPSEEDDDTASVDVPSTQEESVKGEEEDDDEDEEMDMTEEDDDEDLDMTEEELDGGDAKSAGPRSSSTPSAARGALASSASAGAAPKRVKKKVRISDVSTVHSDGRTYNDDDDDDDERESTVDEDDEDDDEEDDDEDDDDSARKKQQPQAFDKIELSDSASMLRMIQSLPELEARRHEQFRRSHFERGAIKRVRACQVSLCISLFVWRSRVCVSGCSAWRK